jgi:hypothetical protein
VPFCALDSARHPGSELPRSEQRDPRLLAARAGTRSSRPRRVPRGAPLLRACHHHGSGPPAGPPKSRLPRSAKCLSATGASGRPENPSERRGCRSSSRGEADRHRAVVADGPVSVSASPPEGLLDAWEARFGSRAEWAVAWFELRPKRLYSYSSA